MKPHKLFISFKFEDSAAEQLHQLVRRACQHITGISLIDGQSIPKIGPFADAITTKIAEEADALVGIFSEGGHFNQNVIYEIGFAKGCGKPVVFVAQKISLVPQMLRAHNIICCKASELDWQDRFRNEFEKQVRNQLKLPLGHNIEEKIRRRYLGEEKQFFKDYKAVMGPINAIRQAEFPRALALINFKRKNGTGHPSDCDFLESDILYLEGYATKDPKEKEECWIKQIEVTAKALKTDPTNVLCLKSKGIGHLRLGQFEEAERELSQAIKNEPQFSVAHYDLACLYASTGDREKMLYHLEKAISLVPEWGRFALNDPDFAAYSEDVDWHKLVYAKENFFGED